MKKTSVRIYTYSEFARGPKHNLNTGTKFKEDKQKQVRPTSSLG